MGNVAKWKTIGKFIIKSDFLILLIRAREGVFLLISCCGGGGVASPSPTPLTHKHKLSLLPYRAVNTLPETYSKRNPIVILHNVYMDQNQSCLSDWYVFLVPPPPGGHLYLKLDINLVKKNHVIRVVFQDHAGNVYAYII